MKNLAQTMLRASVSLARRLRPLRIMMDNATLKHLDKALDDRSSFDIDRAFSSCRRKLLADPHWRFGPTRVHEIAKEAFDGLARFGSIRGKVHCDLGCGAWHPFGIAATMFLNGASSTISMDINDCNKQRAAEALSDLLHDVTARPQEWNWSGSTEFFDRMRQFDLPALRDGKLDQGLAGVPMRHIVNDIHSPTLEEDSIDVMTSQAVLEHFLDFEVAVQRLYDLMRGGGLAFHNIDLVDHRSYGNSKYHYWSFLAEEDDWSDGLVNRLRGHEIRACFENAGFKILQFQPTTHEMPEGFMDRVRGRFRHMSPEQLSVTGVSCVLQKPLSEN